MSGQLQTQGTKEWKTGPLGCFDDPRLCVLTMACPCYVVARNAASLGEDCLLTGLLTAVGLNFGPVLRWRLRQERGLKGSMLMDLLMWICLPWCAAAQEAREAGWPLPGRLTDVGTPADGEANAPRGNTVTVTDHTPDMDRH